MLNFEHSAISLFSLFLSGKGSRDSSNLYELIESAYFLVSACQDQHKVTKSKEGQGRA